MECRLSRCSPSSCHPSSVSPAAVLHLTSAWHPALASFSPSQPALSVLSSGLSSWCPPAGALVRFFFACGWPSFDQCRHWPVMSCTWPVMYRAWPVMYRTWPVMSCTWPVVSCTWPVMSCTWPASVSPNQHLARFHRASLVCRSFVLQRSLCTWPDSRHCSLHLRCAHDLAHDHIAAPALAVSRSALRIASHLLHSHCHLPHCIAAQPLLVGYCGQHAAV
jgi:hypothetical protein